MTVSFPARRRLCAALLTSVAAHAWLLATVPQARQPQLRPPVALAVRLETGSDSISHEVGVEAALSGRDEQPEMKKAPAAPGPRPEPPAPRAREPALPPESSLTPSDPTWYDAHELDSYPRALAPLQLDAGRAGSTGTRLLLWLRIDELGRVVEITAGEAGAPAEVVAAARASLAAVTFVPARKDERAVKSRLLLSVTFRDDR